MQHKTRTRLGIGAGVVIIASIIGGIAGNSTTAPTSAAPSSSPSSSPSPKASEKSYIVSETIRWGYRVTGSAPYGVDITYGNDSDHLGASAVPFYATLHGKAGALYQQVYAQLNGAGDITAKVYKITTARYSDGITAHHREVVATAHATGGYNIAHAEYFGLDAGLSHVGG